MADLEDTSVAAPASGTRPALAYRPLSCTSGASGSCSGAATAHVELEIRQIVKSIRFA